MLAFRARTASPELQHSSSNNSSKLSLSGYALLSPQGRAAAMDVGLAPQEVDQVDDSFACVHVPVCVHVCVRVCVCACVCMLYVRVHMGTDLQVLCRTPRC